MTIRLSGIFEENFQAILENYKEAGRFFENMNYGCRTKKVFLCQLLAKPQRKTREHKEFTDSQESDTEVGKKIASNMASWQKENERQVRAVKSDQKRRNLVHVSYVDHFDDETETDDSAPDDDPTNRNEGEGGKCCTFEQFN